MADMHDKLEEYRLRKRRKQKFDDFKRKIKNFLMLGTGGGIKEQLEREDHIVDVEDDHIADIKKLLPVESKSEEDEVDDFISTTDDEQISTENKSTDVSPAQQEENKVFKYTLWTVYFLFWATVYVIAIELKFGIVYLMFSALLGIYFNTRTGPKKRNEISAYSVFNKNCESIDGTLTAEQFEREMRYGPSSVR